MCFYFIYCFQKIKKMIIVLKTKYLNCDDLINDLIFFLVIGFTWTNINKVEHEKYNEIFFKKKNNSCGLRILSGKN